MNSAIPLTLNLLNYENIQIGTVNLNEDSRTIYEKTLAILYKLITTKMSNEEFKEYLEGNNDYSLELSKNSFVKNFFLLRIKTNNGYVEHDLNTMNYLKQKVENINSIEIIDIFNAIYSFSLADKVKINYKQTSEVIYKIDREFYFPVLVNFSTRNNTCICFNSSTSNYKNPNGTDKITNQLVAKVFLQESRRLAIDDVLKSESPRLELFPSKNNSYNFLPDSTDPDNKYFEFHKVQRKNSEDSVCRLLWNNNICSKKDLKYIDRDCEAYEELMNIGNFFKLYECLFRNNNRVFDIDNMKLRIERDGDKIKKNIANNSQYQIVDDCDLEIPTSKRVKLEDYNVSGESNKLCVDLNLDKIVENKDNLITDEKVMEALNKWNSEDDEQVKKIIDIMDRYECRELLYEKSHYCIARMVLNRYNKTRDKLKINIRDLYVTGLVKKKFGVVD